MASMTLGLGLVMEESEVNKRRCQLRLLGIAAGAVVLAAMGLIIAHTTFGLGAPRYSYLLEEWIYDFVTTVAALATLGRAALRRDGRLGWGLLGLGLLAWAASDLYWTVELGKLAEPPFPSAADAGYLGGYLFVMAGVAALVRLRVRRMSAIAWTDVAIGALAVAAIGTAVLLDYVLANTTGTRSEIAVAVAYPILDLSTLGIAAAALAVTGWRPGLPLGLVAAGIACAAIADCVYTYQSLAGTYDGAAWNNSLWPMATVLIAAGALQPTPTKRQSAPPEGWRGFASPTISAFAIFVLALLTQRGTGSSVVTGLTIATMAAVVLRLSLSFALNSRLVRELERDPLSGLGNRSKLLIDLDRHFSRDGAEPRMLTVLDLDGFKAYNDSFGHPAGDSLLMRLSGQLAEAVEESGSAYRMGGDEFAVIIRGDADSAMPAVAAATKALSERGEGFRVTASSGSAEIPREANDRSTALQLADQRMYADKDSRRPSPGGEVEAVLLRILQQRAPALSNHGNAVAGLATAVGRELSLPPGEIVALGRVAELHDIGKMAIPDAILDKPEPLSDEEWEYMRQHTLLGERIVSAARSMGSVAKVIRSTHERWDGDGYPDGLVGKQTPLAARIVFACDAYDAITSERPYSPSQSGEEALAELKANAGTQFDPAVVEALRQVLRAREVEVGALNGQPARPKTEAAV
jgi:diguanylate cyclase (GGDEF)-like protein